MPFAVPENLAIKINNLLPQTQCTKCGYPACRDYAQAIADKQANFNQCPPGGQEGVERLANLLQQAVIPLNTTHGLERRRPVALIIEAHCIGCTLCIQACPVDAIMGAAKQMHTVIPDLCTGCDLCVASCPVDCIEMVELDSTATGWAAWSPQQAQDAQQRYESRLKRIALEKQETEERLLAKAKEKFRVISEELTTNSEQQQEKERKQQIIRAAIEKASKSKADKLANLAKLGKHAEN